MFTIRYKKIVEFFQFKCYSMWVIGDWLNNSEVTVMYTIHPKMTYDQVVRYYKEYVKDMRRRGQEPVSFLHFLTGRYECKA